MNRVFYIFRHGETNWNRERRCQGHTNIALNETGLKQAQLLAQKLKGFPLKRIITSDLDRARVTGEYVAESLSIPIQVDSRLREMNAGEAEGMLYEETIAQFGHELWANLSSFKRENDHCGFPGGETRKMARDRFLSLLDDLILSSTDEHIGISTHGGALRNVIHHFLPEETPIIPIPNCVVYKLHYDSTTRSFQTSPIPFLTINHLK
jgi:probable phosphoglycerate mutase